MGGGWNWKQQASVRWGLEKNQSTYGTERLRLQAPNG